MRRKHFTLRCDMPHMDRIRTIAHPVAGQGGDIPCVWSENDLDDRVVVGALHRPNVPLRDRVEELDVAACAVDNQASIR